jgi:oligopeptide/dipeptide ABC transporter ATP-binding protein
MTFGSGRGPAVTSPAGGSGATSSAWGASPTGPGGTTRPPLVEVEGLVKYYPIVGGFLRRHIGDVKAVDDVTFDVRRGEVFGLVGESGCGKSTLGKTLIQLQRPTAGSAKLDGVPIFGKKGKELKKLRRRMQIIFQDPVGSLNPRMPISDIIGEGLLAQADPENHWGDRKVRDKRVGDFLDAVGLRRDYTRRYPHEFSGGQRQRIGIARALALDPDFVVCDEPVSALDVSIQSQILNLLLDLRREFHLTYLFIAHNLSVVQYISDRVGVMYLGKLVELSEVEELYRRPLHPYSVALLSAVPDPDPRIRKKRLVLKGDVPSPAAPPSGCRFHTRCWLREQLGNPEDCSTVEPPFRDVGGGHLVACHHAGEVPTSVVASAVPTVEAAEYVPAPPSAEGSASEPPSGAGRPAAGSTASGT